MRLGRDLRLLFLSMFLWSLGDGLYLYTWPAYVRELGADAPQLGLLYALGFAAMALSYLPGGALADRWDRKWAMIAGWAVATPAPICYLLARNWAQLLPGVIMYHVSTFAGPALRAYTAHFTPPQRLATTFALLDASWPLGMVISPLLGGMWAERAGIRPVLLASLLIFCLSTLILLGLSSQRPHRNPGKAPPSRSPFSYPEARAVIALSALVYFLQHLALPFTTPFWQDVPHLNLAHIGLLGSAVALGGGLLSPWLGTVGDRRGRSPALALSLSLLVASFALLLLSRHLWLLAVASFLQGAGLVSWSLLAAMLAAALPPEAHGRGFAVGNLVAGLATAAGPYPGGWLYRTHPYLPFAISLGSLLLLSLWLYYQKFRMTSRSPSL